MMPQNVGLSTSWLDPVLSPSLDDVALGRNHVANFNPEWGPGHVTPT